MRAHRNYTHGITYPLCKTHKPTYIWFLPKKESLKTGRRRKTTQNPEEKQINAPEKTSCYAM